MTFRFSVLEGRSKCCRGIGAARRAGGVRGVSVCLSVCLSVSLSVCLSVCLSVFLSVCLSVCLSEWMDMSARLCGRGAAATTLTTALLA